MKRLAEYFYYRFKRVIFLIQFLGFSTDKEL